MDLYLDVAGRELRDPDTGDVARDLKIIAETVMNLQRRSVAGPTRRSARSSATRWSN